MTENITIAGNVAAAPEQRRTAAGAPIATFRVGCTQRRYDRATDTWVDDGTHWYSVSAFRRLAEHVLSSIGKGDPVIVSGRLKVRQWDNGTRQGTSVDIDADVVGHDLRWGSTAFRKRADAARGDGGSGDAWAVEGHEPAAPSTPEADLSWPSAEPAAQGSPALVGADAPF